MMGVFETVRESVTVRQVAEHYGLPVNRYGMAVCPFHDDRNPSMKIDRRYYCFGCGAKGDAIDYVSKQFGLSLKDAAVKIADDFGLTYEKWKPPNQSRNNKKIIRIKPLHERYRETVFHFWRVITDYHSVLCDWKIRYAPTDTKHGWDDHFVEALKSITQLEYVMDTFLEGDLETKVDIIIEYGRKTAEYERRIKEFAAGEAGGAGTNNAGNGKSTKTEGAA